jgi:tryptophan-rich sensory protein
LAAEVKQDDRVIVWGRRGLALAAFGLGVQLVATFHWTPATFVLSAALGIPCVLLGAAVFGVAVLRNPIRGGS